MAQGGRGRRRRCRRLANAGLVPRGPLRCGRGRRLGGAPAVVGDAPASPAPVGRVLVGRAVVARLATRSVLGRTPAREPEADALGSRSASPGRLSADRTRQRVAAASPVVRQQRDGRSPGIGFRPGRGAQALRLSRSAARAQGRSVLASDGALARSLQRRFRRAAVRSDQHLFRGQRLGFAGGRQASPRLQPRQAAGLSANRDRPRRHARGPAAGLRGSARQYGGLQDAADVSGQDRGAIRQGAARL